MNLSLVSDQSLIASRRGAMSHRLTQALANPMEVAELVGAIEPNNDMRDQLLGMIRRATVDMEQVEPASPLLT